MSDTAKHSVSVAGVVVDDSQRVLLVQRRDNGHWEPPGGVLELNETVEDGVRREVEEETGVSVEVARLTGVYKNVKRGIVALVFRCKPISGSARPTEESSNVEWLDLADALSRMDEAYAVRVSDAYQDVPAIRAHDGVQLLTRL
ncbi:NUDIX hydrolase [Saccharopolyspora phatthalungensis]|uniref:ADP-ribose pyrophosphatase YjhB (NUDIX family) n=1 Tax=Saccharopolyspora phatthalungensis TaxID=664693 RepID=A0A840Q360_9PSEU|nr:NUDIX hydrolase [Saccharopolyspora phatthalungensis]MBB5154041.1 ADP-ribose pyrophosphatase YjhB (NUDIX family) [Saccharopolyspora phatthalungensis]